MSREEFEDLEKEQFKDNLQSENIELEKSLFALILAHFGRLAKRYQKKEQISRFHARMIKENGAIPKKSIPHKIRSFSRKYLVTSMVAASVTLVVMIGVFLAYNHIISLEKKQIIYYQSLSRELNKIKSKTTKIEQAFTQDQDNDKKVTKYFGATAFLVDTAGYFVTDYHVIKGSRFIYAEKDTLSFKLALVAIDPKHDLALLRIQDSLFKSSGSIQFTIDTTSKAQLGEDIFTLAYPKEELVYGEGTIASLKGFESDSSSYQISIPVNPGSSGAPVLNYKGELVGIVTGKNTEAEGAAYATKSKYLYKLMKQNQLPINYQATKNKTTEQPPKDGSKSAMVSKISSQVYLLKTSY